MERISAIDAVRGIAVLWMIWFQTWDFFSKDFKLYSEFWYQSFDFFNWLPIFAIVSGLCISISVSGKLEGGWPKLKVFVHGIRRYGFYILVSFFICLWTLDLDIFLSFDEILGAIGIYALITLTLILVFHGHKFLLMIAIYLMSFRLRELFYTGFLNGENLIVPQFLRGYTIWLMLPFFFSGVFIADMVLKKEIKNLILFAVSLLPLSFMLSYLGDQTSYEFGTLSFNINNVIVVLVLFALTIHFEKHSFLGILGFFGKHALFFCSCHYILWYKLLLETGLIKSFDLLSSVVLTVFSIFLPAFVMFLIDRYGLRKKLPLYS